MSGQYIVTLLIQPICRVHRVKFWAAALLREAGLGSFSTGLLGFAPLGGFPWQGSPQRVSFQPPTLEMLMGSSRKKSGCSSTSFSVQTGLHRRELPALHFSSAGVEKGSLLS